MKTKMQIMTELKKTIMLRDGLSGKEADALIAEAKERIFTNGENPQDVLRELSYYRRDEFFAYFRHG
jgi:hypothetical protein